MLRKILCLLIVSPSLYATTPLWEQADIAFKQKDDINLSRMYIGNPDDVVIGYLYSVQQLEKNNPQYAQKMLKSAGDNSFVISVGHKLLTYYFNDEFWTSYQNIYKNMPTQTINDSERCGLDISNLNTVKTTLMLQSDVGNIIRNPNSAWCLQLVSLDKSVTNSVRNIALAGLILNGKTEVFNQVAPFFGIRSINFNPRKNATNQFIIINQISKQAKNNPQEAQITLNKFKSYFDINMYKYLANYMAMRYATQQDFAMAIQLYKQNKSPYLSNEMQEWKARSYLAMADWNNVLSAINDMPSKIQNKNSWLYWKGISYEALNNESAAKQLFSQLSNDYSYYALLAKAELGLSANFKTNPIVKKNINQLQYSANIKRALALYQLSKEYKSNTLLGLATSEWNYAVQRSDDADLLLISKLARDNSWYDMSIYAANHMDIRYLELSFPDYFLDSYKKFAALYGVDVSYQLAITRQESRFKYDVTAFDGGIGLMQIMPGTAKYIARKSKSSDCVKDYACNIKFGTWYLNSLINSFENNIIYSTAAYNAGPNRTHKWQTNLAHLDNRIQIELIPIGITRDYVQKVLSNKAIYDSRLNKHPEINLLQYVQGINKSTVFKPTDDTADVYKMRSD